MLVKANSPHAVGIGAIMEVVRRRDWSDMETVVVFVLACLLYWWGLL
ncbi:hypothetical protein [Nocardia arizonensis]|nr:hypothetical protein [Nocardia arizonensis]